LRLFHQRHFPDAPLPLFLKNTPDEVLFEEEDEDELGYYPDGAKRTLTNEQIAIFRHSEIQELIKQARLSDERERSISPGVDPSREGSRSAGLDPPNKISGKMSYKRKRAWKTKPPKSKRGKRDSQPSLEQGVSRHDPLDYMSEGEDRTHRRKAREDDEQKAEDFELDY